MTQPRLARTRPAIALTAFAITAVAVAGCSGSTTPSAVASAVAQVSFPPVATEAPTAAASQEPAASSGAQASETVLPSAVATDIDPCQLITADEAGTLVGTTFGAGKESTTENNLRICSYAGPGPNIFTVEVAVAPDEATAKAAEAQAQQDLIAKAKDQAQLGLHVTQLPGFAANTDAAIIEGSIKSPLAVEARGMLLLRGVVFVGFSDLAVGGSAPSQDAMKTQANAVLAKLP